MGRIQEPHDKVFKASLSNITIARDFFKVHLPATILSKIDLDSLVYCNNSYIEQNLSGKFADLVYYSKSSSNSESYLYLLLEHQAKPDRLMPWRMLKYQIAIIEQHLKQDPHAELFPTVYPILFFQGRHNKLYPYSLDLLDLFGDRDFAAATFAKPAFLVDLNKFSDQEIMHKHNLIALVEYMQKHSRDRDLMLIIEQLKQMILMISKRLGADQNLLEFYLKCNLYYIMQVGKISDPQAFMQELATVPIIQGEIMGSIARELKAIGKAEGIVEGIAEGQVKGIIKGIIEGKKQTAISMRRKGLDLKLISEVTNLTIEEINKLKEEKF